MTRYLDYKKEISAEAWFKAIEPLLKEGYQFKVYPYGCSMVPFLCGGRDEAVLSIPDNNYKYKKNDIVLYKVNTGMHVLHRICCVNKTGIYILGDGETDTEGPYQQEDILAIVDYIIRKGKVIMSDNKIYICLVSIWRLLRPFRPKIIRMYSSFRRIEKKFRKANTENIYKDNQEEQ